MNQANQVPEFLIIEVKLETLCVPLDIEGKKSSNLMDVACDLICRMVMWFVSEFPPNAKTDLKSYSRTDIDKSLIKALKRYSNCINSSMG